MTTDVTHVGITLALAIKSVGYAAVVRRLGRPWDESLLVGAVRSTLGGVLAYLILALVEALALALLLLLPLVRWAHWLAVLRLVAPDPDRGDAMRRAAILVGWSFLLDAVVVGAVWQVPGAMRIMSATFP